MAPHTITPAVGEFPRACHHFKRRRRWAGVKGNTRNGCHFPKRLSPRRLGMVREDTGILTEGATCAWRAAEEAIGFTRVRVHSGMAADWADLVSSHAKLVEVYSQKVISGSKTKVGNTLGSLQVPWDETHSGYSFPGRSKTVRF
ncbi:hypothetical protein TNCV_2476391 [Trichonephila clavipes]|nr:hypothetical protein TNCV_2476391 [Trichonephila clavipes]